MKIGILGGTFNPPHLGHLAAAKAAAETLKLDQLVFVPVGIPPHKSLPERMPSDEQRLEMVSFMADQMGRPELTLVWDEEIKRPGLSFTSDTLCKASQLWPDAELWLLVGTDMFLTLQDWNKPDLIMSKAGICTFGRSVNENQADLDRQERFLTEKYQARIVRISIPDLVDTSSTEIRGALLKGSGKSNLPQRVYGYILREKLYGTSADLKNLSLEDLRSVSYSMVKAKRVPHVLGTEEESASLALRWGAEEDTMRKAAILHDCTKYWHRKDHLAVCEQCGLELDEVERENSKLLHAKTGAILAHSMFGQSDEVCRAIYFHTTGRAGMTLAEKILYIGDYIEPTRDFREAEEMRRLAYIDLDQTVALGASISVHEMKENKKTIHPNTLEAWEFYRKKA